MAFSIMQWPNATEYAHTMIKLIELLALDDVGPKWRATPIGQRCLEWLPSPAYLEEADFSVGWMVGMHWTTFLEHGMLVHERLEDLPLE